MNCKLIRFSEHAVKQMFHRRISRDDVRDIIRNNDVIKEYVNDKPYPSKLLLGFPLGFAIHVVVAYDEVTETCIIVTAYKPDPDLWDNHFKTRRPK